MEQLAAQYLPHSSRFHMSRFSCFTVNFDRALGASLSQGPSFLNLPLKRSWHIYCTLASLKLQAFSENLQYIILHTQ